MKPGINFDQVKVNAQGFNDRDHKQKKNKNALRIAVIGDSFVFGVVPRDLNFVSIIEHLATASGENVEVLNMGIPASGPHNYIDVLKKEASSMQVDMAIVVFFVGNDIIQSHPDFVTKIFFGSPRDVLAKPYLVGLSTRYFLSWRLITASARVLRERFRSDKSGTFSKESFLEIEKQRAEACKLKPSVFMKESYESSLSIIKEMKNIARNKGISFCVVLAPDEIQVNQELQMEMIKKYNFNRADYDFLMPQQQMINDLNHAGIAVVDLLPAFLVLQKEESLYVNQDTHWNETGNKLAGELIWLFIKNQKQIDLDKAL